MERRFPRVKMVLDNSLQLAEWEIHPETPGADPGRIMGQTLQRAGRAGLMALTVAGPQRRRLRGRPRRPDLQPPADRPAAGRRGPADHRGRGRARRPAGPRARLAGRGPLRRPQLGAVVGPHRRARHRPRRPAGDLVRRGHRHRHRLARRRRAAPSSAPYLEERGRFFPGGHCPTVGIGGFLLQGGQGWNARGWGWAAEYVEAIDVVTADRRAGARVDGRERRPLLGRARCRARASSASSPASTCARCRARRTSRRPCTPTTSTTSTR